MAAEQSSLSKLSPQALVRISQTLIDKGFETEIYGDYYDNWNRLSGVLKFLDKECTDLDLQFMGEFIEKNDAVLSEIFETNDKNLFPRLVIPQAKEYKIEYSLDGSCHFTEIYTDKISSYSQWWIEDSLNERRSQGEWEEYNGTLVRTDYDNYETSDFTFDGYKVIAESPKKSILDRLVLENTSEVVSSLDRDTLIELKKIIDSRLSSL